ncbi:MAG: MurR/RpiR family transcriptional regulator [Pseudomonadota bacterium]
MVYEIQPAQDYATLRDLLRERAPTLPRRLKQCAAFALAHPQDLALGTVAEIAERAGVQPSALVRFSQALGYRGFSDLQRVFRSQLIDRWPDYPVRLQKLGEARLEGPAALLDGMIDTAMTSLADLRHNVDAAALGRATTLLAAADTVYVMGIRRSYPVAAYLGYALARLGVRARVVDGVGGMATETVRAVGPNDAVCAFSFTPYAPETLAFARDAADNGAPLLAITDGPLSPITPMAEVWLAVNEASLGGFRSTAATFCVAMALAVAVGSLDDNVPAGAC